VTAALGLIIIHEGKDYMKELLTLMLVHYYQDSKRATSATITRRLDKSIRKMSGTQSGLARLVSDCKKTAEAAKRQERTAFKKSRIPSQFHNSPHVKITPCSHD